MIYLLKQAKANNHIIRADGDIWVDVDGTIRVNKASGGQVIAGKYSEFGRADAVVRDIFDAAKFTGGDTFYIMPDKQKQGGMKRGQTYRIINFAGIGRMLLHSLRDHQKGRIRGMSKIGNYIRDVMAAKDIKPAKVAKEHPIKYNTLWQVVAGKVLPSDAVLEVVAVAIHEPLSKLRAIASEDRIERLHAKDIAEGLMVKPTPERIINAEETKKKNQEDIIMAILNERKRQDKKWGEQNHLPQFWSGILGEEFGELCQAINETVFDNGSDKGGYENMRTEAIHVAAVAVGFLECLERNKEAWGLAANEEH